MSIQLVIEHMRTLNDLHGRLLDIANRKKDALIVNAIDEINSLVNQEVKLVRQIASTDAQRLEAIGSFLQEQGIIADSVTVTDIVKLVFNVDERREITEQRERLLGTIGQLKELNDVNQQLIEQSLAYLDYSLDVVSGGSESEVVYQRPQGSSAYQASRRGLFDKKA